MAKFFYGSFETILRTYITPNITQENLADILLLSPIIDKEIGQEAKDAIRSQHHINKGNVSKFCKGIRQIPQKLLEDHLTVSAFKNIEHCFYTEIVPRIPINSRVSIKEEIVSLICQDDNISEEEKTYYKETAIKKELCPFLVETYLLAVTGISTPMKTLTEPIYTNLPSRNSLFCGREEVLQILRTGYQNDVHIQGLFGMGGIGKTQIALEYAYTYLDEYQIVWWFQADNKLTLRNSVFDFLSSQGVLPEDKDTINIQRAFRSYCDRHDRWLFVYDNAEYGTSKEYETLLAYFPHNASNGDILLTTRCKAPFENSNHNEVTIWEYNEATVFLEQRSGIVDKKNAGELAKLMGFLPLALEYAAAYIRETPDVDYVAYIKKLKKYSIKLLDRKVGHHNMYERTVREAFHITLDRILEDKSINDISKSAQQFLYICAFLFCNGIEMNPFLSYGKDLPEPIRSILNNELDKDDMMRLLTKYSLVKINNNAVYIHNLLQEILLDEMELRDFKIWLDYAFCIFRNIEFDFMGSPLYRSRPVLTKLAPHVQSVLSHYLQYYNRSKESFDIEYISKEYFMWTAFLLADNTTIPMKEWPHEFAKDIPMLESLVGFYDTIPNNRNIYLAWALELLAQANNMQNNIDVACKQYIRAINIIESIIENPPNNSIEKLIEFFYIAHDIYLEGGEFGITNHDSDLLWKSYMGLVKIFYMQLSYFPDKMPSQTWTALNNLSIIIAEETQHIFILRLKNGSDESKEFYTFYCPPNNISLRNDDFTKRLREKFDVILKKNEKNNNLKLENNSWITLAFDENIQNEDDMLNVLRRIEFSKQCTNERRVIYSLIYCLAKNLHYDDISLMYAKKLKELGRK